MDKITEDAIKECRKRKKEFERMIDDLNLMRLALIRSIATEDLNIAKLKEQKNG